MQHVDRRSPNASEVVSEWHGCSRAACGIARVAVTFSGTTVRGIGAWHLKRPGVNGNRTRTIGRDLPCSPELPERIAGAFGSLHFSGSRKIGHRIERLKT